MTTATFGETEVWRALKRIVTLEQRVNVAKLGIA